MHKQARVLAANYRSRERADHMLQPTALVNEAYRRLLRQQRVTWKNRAHFLGIAANITRRILVEALMQQKRTHEADRIRVLDPAPAAVPACTPGGDWREYPDT